MVRSEAVIRSSWIYPHARRTRHRLILCVLPKEDKAKMCAIAKKNDVPENLQTARIVPLEIGGNTVQHNLILLRRQCHKAYDAGQCSINAMSKVAEELGAGGFLRFRYASRYIRTAALRRPSPRRHLHSKDTLQQVSEFARKCWFVRATSVINEQLSGSGLTQDERAYLSITRAELTRRRVRRRSCQ